MSYWLSMHAIMLGQGILGLCTFDVLKYYNSLIIKSSHWQQAILWYFFSYIIIIGDYPICRDEGNFSKWRPIWKFSNASLLSYFLRLYNWLSWLFLHWAMPLVPSEHSKPLPKSHSIIGQKGWFPLLFLFSTLIFLLPAIKASWVSFFTVLQHLGWGCATTGSKEKTRLSADEFHGCKAVWFDAI